MPDEIVAQMRREMLAYVLSQKGLRMSEVWRLENEIDLLVIAVKTVITTICEQQEDSSVCCSSNPHRGD